MFSRSMSGPIVFGLKMMQKRLASSTIVPEDRFSLAAREVSDYYYKLVTPISCALGAEVTQMDLSQPPDPMNQRVIRRALDEFSVLIFRGMEMNGPQMVESLKFLGNVEIEQNHVDQGLTLPGCPECFALKNGPNNPPTFDCWHSDKVGSENPIQYTVFACKKIPVIGGDTLISNNRKAFASLSPGMQNIFRDMNGVYNERNAFVNNPKIVSYLKRIGFKADGVYDHFQDQIHPIVRKNPRNLQEALYFSPPYLSRMEGFSEEESRYFQDLLLKTIAKPEFVYRHSWMENDLMIIDNTATSHYNVCDYFPEARELYRIVITDPEYALQKRQTEHLRNIPKQSYSTAQTRHMWICQNSQNSQNAETRKLKP
jgi:taurine dioxygenase